MVLVLKTSGRKLQGFESLPLCQHRGFMMVAALRNRWDRVCACITWAVVVALLVWHLFYLIKLGPVKFILMWLESFFCANSRLGRRSDRVGLR